MTTALLSTAERIRAMLVKDYLVDPGKVTPEVQLDDLGIDSLGVTELMFNIEDEFSLALRDEPMQLSTFGDVVSYIDRLVAAQGPAPDSSTALAGSIGLAP